MSEIAKLRARLKNTTKSATEYRMTVDEARALLKEIDNMQAIEAPPKVIVKEIPIAPKVLDGGSFDDF